MSIIHVLAAHISSADNGSQQGHVQPKVATYSTRPPESVGLGAHRAELPGRSGVPVHHVAACTWLSALQPVMPLFIVPLLHLVFCIWLALAEAAVRAARAGGRAAAAWSCCRCRKGRNMLALGSCEVWRVPAHYAASPSNALALLWCVVGAAS